MPDRLDIVVLAPLYPSASGAVPAAAMRTRGLCRALAELGHRVDVICGMPLGASPELVEGVTSHATRWVDFDGVLGRIRKGAANPASAGGAAAPAGRALASRLLPPDRYLTWIPGAIVGARRVLRDDSVVLSTSAKSAHLAARAVAGGRPWIADLNDPWTDNPHMPVGVVRGRVDGWLEGLGLGGATQITTVTPPLRDELAARFGNDRVTTVMSGFDLELVEAVAEPPAGKSVILYAGTLYERFDLEPLYRGLATERAAGTITPETLGLRFVGRLNDRVLAEADAHGVADFFAVSGPVARAEILSLMSQATALLLPLYEDDPYSLPMKFYEYVGAGRPIVAVGPSDRFAARLVEEHALGAVLSSADDVGALLRRLALDPNALAAPTRASRERFTWKHTAAALEEVLERAAASTRARG